MPIRSRSHELEDESFRRFEDALPSAWVMRRKQPDYGIDCEVELFEDDGRSTGLTFLVQLRATDNSERATVVPLETDELLYYRQLDLPVAVVRYCSAGRSLHWRWANMISARRRLRSEQKTVSFRFGEEDRWISETPSRIRRTLEVSRAVLVHPAGAPVPIRLDLSRLPPVQRYGFERATGEAIADSEGALVRAGPDELLVEVLIAPEPAFLAIRLDSVASVTFDHPGHGPEQLIDSTLYGLANLLNRKRLPRQAAAIARLLARRARPHPMPELRMEACDALVGELPTMAEMAIISGFHHQTSANYPAIVFKMIHAPQAEDARREAVDRFFGAALLEAEQACPETLAAAHYSVANFHRARGDVRRALRHYFRAYRLRPAYGDADYFIEETAGALFLAGRYSASAKAYGTARLLRDDPYLSLLLGDALLMSGDVRAAGEALEYASEHLPAGRLSQEAGLDAMVARWLAVQALEGHLPRRRPEADRAMSLTGMDSIARLQEVVRGTDALNPRARFNLGVHASRENDHRTAMFNFLTCAYASQGDAAAWSNAAHCALILTEDAVLLAILTVGIHHAGAEVYDLFRAKMAAHGVQADGLEYLDEIATTLLAEAGQGQAREFTIRILDGDGHKAMTIGGYGRNPLAGPLVIGSAPQGVQTTDDRESTLG